jgi:hypothetical protein
MLTDVSFSRRAKWAQLRAFKNDLARVRPFAKPLSPLSHRFRTGRSGAGTGLRIPGDEREAEQGPAQNRATAADSHFELSSCRYCFLLRIISTVMARTATWYIEP